MQAELISEFRRRFDKDPEHLFFCPGRVNLIGEHMDYNGGHVLPCAIEMGTWLAVSRNTDKFFRFEALDFPETARLHLQESYTKTGKTWFNYPLGVINEIFQEGHALSGLEMLYSGNLPIGAGLSSSASVEIVTIYALDQLFALGIPKIEMARICKRVENEFIGVNSGIMDQFAVVMGKENQAILLDCDSLEHQYIPVDTRQYALVIINSNKQRKLEESKYNERFAECGAVLKILKRFTGAEHLCDISRKQFDNYRQYINDPLLEKRALHVINEQQRVGEAADKLKANDLAGFGRLMYASHRSLQQLYEVSGRELDTIVEFCEDFPACIGARMTGAGFGGCAIALVKKESLDEFSSKLSEYYTAEIGYAPEVYATGIGNGVKKIS